jgi:hypothetical protein
MLVSCEKETKKDLAGTRWVSSVNGTYLVLEFTSSSVRAYSADRNFIRNDDAIGDRASYHFDENGAFCLEEEMKVSFYNKSYSRKYTITAIYTYDYPNSLSVSSEPYIGSFTQIK